MTDYEAVIGLEIHAQLKTKAKLFSRSSTEFHAPENTNVGPVDAGLPGTLPVVNKAAVEMAVRAGLALNCTINSVSEWSRKHYFYPDLPKGYQISQFQRPLCSNGSVMCSGERRIRIQRIHMEEDAGKNIHEGQETFVNLNRAGIPLIEIVSEPDIRSAKEAAEYMKKIRTLLRYVDVCDGNLEEGSMRCDVNLSLRPRGTEPLGTKVELKNINSFKFVEMAVEGEIERQLECLRSGTPIVQETRSFNAEKGTSTSMRSKEDAHDYRYFPEPDLPLLVLPKGFVENIREHLPDLPDVLREKLITDWGLPEYDAEVLTASRAVSDYFLRAMKTLKNAKQTSNWIMTTLLKDVSEDMAAEAFPVSVEHFTELLTALEAGSLNPTMAKQVYEEMRQSRRAPSVIIQEKGLVQITDTSQIEKEIDAVLNAFPQETTDYLSGKDKLLGFFMGQIMKRTKGQANPKVAQEAFQRVIDRRKSSS